MAEQKGRPNDSYWGWEEDTIRFLDEDVQVQEEVEVRGALRRVVEKGGKGSGHFEHEGREGEVGGSEPSGEAGGDVAGVERLPQHDADGADQFEVYLDRAREMHNEGKFAMVTRDLKTGEYLFITDREVAIDKMGNDRRNDLKETLYGFNDVNLTFVKRGDQSNVHLDHADISDLKSFAEQTKDAGETFVLSHNHPASDSEGETMPPSLTDILTAMTVNAGEIRSYGADGDYIVTIDSTKFNEDDTDDYKTSRGLRRELREVANDYNQTNYEKALPGLDREWSGEEQEAHLRENDLFDELRDFQITRLGALSDALPWLSYEFRPLSEEANG